MGELVFECERCFITTNPGCPSVSHKCALEEALGDLEERKWALENLDFERLPHKALILRGTVKK